MGLGVSGASPMAYGGLAGSLGSRQRTSENSDFRVEIRGSKLGRCVTSFSI